jgi:hypothetical protein
VAARGARAAAAMPVIGFLSFQSPGPPAPHLSAYRRGLNEEGYIEGQNVRIEFRWAEGRSDWSFIRPDPVDISPPARILSVFGP